MPCAVLDLCHVHASVSTDSTFGRVPFVNIRKWGQYFMPFQIIRNDITKMKTDAIVSPAGFDALVGGGVDSAVFRAAGMEELLAKRWEIGKMEAGEAVATSAGELSCRYIFHVCSPVFQDGSHGEEQLLKDCYEKCLALAVERKCESIAFPLLSAGSNGYPRDLALTAAVSVFRDFLQTREMEIYLVVFDGESTALSGELFSDVRAYVDEHYVETALREEYEGGRRRKTLFKSLLRDAGQNREKTAAGHKRSSEKKTGSVFKRKLEREDEYDSEEEMMFDRSSESEDNSLPQGPVAPAVFSAAPAARAIASPAAGTSSASGAAASPAAETSPAAGAAVSPVAAAAPAAASLALDDFIHQNTGSFEEYLQQLINRKGMTNAEVYKKANLSKQYFSKVMHEQVKPAKEKLLCIAIALKLNLDETADFLRIAGFALSPCSKTDLVFEYFIIRQNFDIFSIDIALFDCGLPSLMD